jgi:hypothetical protein
MALSEHNWRPPAETDRIEGPIQPDERVVMDVLATVLERTEQAGIPYVVIGGIASTILGRPRWTHDIDVFVRREDARRLLRVLADAGFQTEERDQEWLYKATRDDVLVDVLFAVTAPNMPNGIALDDQALARARRREFNGLRPVVVAPEDLVVIKAAVHAEHRSRHWFDALGILHRGGLDWRYLVERSLYAPRRVLSLLLYAQSEGLDVPGRVVRSLFERLDEPAGLRPDPTARGRADEPGAYTLAHVREALARDARTAELEVDVMLEDGGVVLTGTVATPERRDAITDVVRRALPDCAVRNHTAVPEPGLQPHVEQL